MASDIGRKSFSLERLMAALPNCGDRREHGRAAERLKVLPVFVEAIADKYVQDPQVSFTDEELKGFGWFDFQFKLYARRTGRGRESRILNIMRETVELFHDIKTQGLKAPLDMWREGKRYVLARGWRRLLILDVLHRRGLKVCPAIPARIFKSRDSFHRHMPSTICTTDDSSINSLAIKQFAELGVRDTDKYWTHGYTHLYDTHFNQFRDQRIKMLELGVSRGASLILWEKVFRKGRFYGVDTRARRWRRMLKNHKRVKVFVGSQSDPEFLQKEVIPAGPFDIIIDDASHVPEDQLVSFKSLWPHVARNGFYVIEDLHGNYWKHKAKHGPLMMNVIKGHLDDLVAADNTTNISAIHAYYNIVFIRKRK